MAMSQAVVSSLVTLDDAGTRCPVVAIWKAIVHGFKNTFSGNDVVEDLAVDVG